MKKHYLDEFFAKKGIEVHYNTLGDTEDLARAYASNFEKIVERSSSQQSHTVKHGCYSTMYSLISRKKLTGFEEFLKIDNQFRRDISPLITESQFSNTIIAEKISNTSNISYKSELKNHVQKFQNPLLYLSGGLDSELVALAMIDSDVKFTPVIFNFVNNSGKICNQDENRYAFDFCANHKLFPIVKTINIEQLWKSQEFARLAIETQTVSPHIVTHAYMALLMASEYKDRVHLFGGEVRFYANYRLDNQRYANLILLDKVTSPSYQGVAYQSIAYEEAASGGAAICSLDYNFTLGLGVAQQWSINGSDELLPISGPFVDNWATSSAISQSTYQYRIEAATVNNVSPTDIISNYTDAFTPGTWATISPGSTTIAFCSAEYTNMTVAGSANITVTFTIILRSTADPGNTVTSTVQLRATSYEGEAP